MLGGRGRGIAGSQRMIFPAPRKAEPESFFGGRCAIVPSFISLVFLFGAVELLEKFFVVGGEGRGGVVV